MTDRVVVLDATKHDRRQPVPRGAEVIDSHSRVREVATARTGAGKRRRTVWLARRREDLDLLSELIGQGVSPKGDHSLVVTDEVGRGRSEVLRALFRFLVSEEHDVRLLPAHELVEVLTSPARQDLLIGLAIDRDDSSLVLYRGTLDSFVVPVSFFGAGAASALEGGDFEVIDHGHGVRFGQREASTNAILYAFDTDFRRRRKAQLVERDPSFGGALRRLRLLRGLSRSDFGGISAKEIARIERGEVRRPHARTLSLIARRLGVAPDDIGSY
jgi:hypothetical protein